MNSPVSVSRREDALDAFERAPYHALAELGSETIAELLPTVTMAGRSGLVALLQRELGRRALGARAQAHAPGAHRAVCRGLLTRTIALICRGRRPW